MTKYKATALLLNWKRPKNLIRSIDVLREMDVEILLWNNNPDDKTKFDVDMQINADQNQYCWVRWGMSRFATTDYVFTLDDDLMITDLSAIDKCIERINHLPSDAIVGYTGVILSAEKQYKSSYHVDRPLPNQDMVVDIIKGRFMFMRKEFCESIKTDKNQRRQLNRGDDIYVSSKSQTKIVLSSLHQSMRELPEGNVGLWMQGNHYPIRQQATDIFFS